MKSLLKAFQSIFGCRHRHQSRVFTIRPCNYRVCFDCGKEFDLPDAHVPMRSKRCSGRPLVDEFSQCSLKLSSSCRRERNLILHM
jgi:DNA-directed RNA polymerase subunit RPC12/RpoP